jgi:xanthine dehydrogenase YagR molybdenum-binding subunit
MNPPAAISMGKPLSRVEGRLKVTGTAKYPAEFRIENVAFGFLVASPIAKGRIAKVDSSAVEKAPGFVALLTHLNAPKLKEPPNKKDEVGIRIEQRIPLTDDVIHYAGQYVALVVADSLEHARHAADLLKIEFAPEKPAVRKEDALGTAKKPPEGNGEKLQVTKGDADAALKNPEFVTITQTYGTPTETHNPMECSATIAVWEGADRLVFYDATQYVKGTQGIVAHAFGLPRENVRVICPYVGGAFGCKGPVWPHTLLAAMAAKLAARPVKVELTRHQMFTGTGHRPPTWQTVALAASKDGKLQGIRHQSEMLNSTVGAWVEPCGIGSSNVLYDAPAIEFEHIVYAVNRSQPSFMRAPGECPGTYAVECAMDELAVALAMDPLQLRLVNDSPNHPIKGVPWSTKNLSECYKLGAEKFGWAARKPQPGATREGRLLVGWGLATATYPANKWAAEVRIRLAANGQATVQCAAHDLGTGAYTALTQIAADALGLPEAAVKMELGNSDLPFGPVAGGSNSTATVGSAIIVAADKLRAELAKLAVGDAQSPLKGAKADDLKFLSEGRLGTADAARSEQAAAILARAGKEHLEVEGGIKEEKNTKMGFQSFGAHFCEVKIDPDFPMVRVSRVVSVMDCGRVINPKTGRSQIIGGVVMGIGMALHEETVYDLPTGLPATRNLADYHVPVHADVPEIDVYFVGQPDFAFNPTGGRGMGEIGITGISAAIANAVYHATGKRVRELPITLDKLLA